MHIKFNKSLNTQCLQKYQKLDKDIDRYQCQMSPETKHIYGLLCRTCFKAVLCAL